MSKEQVLKIALTAGKILLVSGAETYRVEDTMLRICREGGMTTIAAFCTPSLIMIGEETMEGASLMYRVTHRGTDLTLISEVNDMSFHMPTWGKSFQDTMAILEEKTMRKPRPAREEIFWSGLAGAFFAVVLGGGPLEFLAALLGSLLSMAFVKAVSPFRPSSFWETTMAGAIICLTVVLFRMACPDLVMELAIAGGVMPHLPGRGSHFPGGRGGHRHCHRPGHSVLVGGAYAAGSNHFHQNRIFVLCHRGFRQTVQMSGKLSVQGRLRGHGGLRGVHHPAERLRTQFHAQQLCRDGGPLHLQ